MFFKIEAGFKGGILGLRDQTYRRKRGRSQEIDSCFEPWIHYKSLY